MMARHAVFVVAEQLVGIARIEHRQANQSFLHPLYGGLQTVVGLARSLARKARSPSDLSHALAPGMVNGQEAVIVGTMACS